MEPPVHQARWTGFLSKFQWFRPRDRWDPKEARQTLRWLNNSYGKGTAAMYHQLPNSSAEGNHAVPFPTRLLDLGPPPGTPKHGGLRLVTPSTTVRGSYVTLSHRWGDTKRLKLTAATLHAQTERIAFESLPRTFQDAVMVSRCLGFRYLWIDALCIVQDDEQDWLQEAAKMASVYRNSSCTISAHAAHDDDEGFLHTRQRQVRSISHLVAASDLSQRGWVFQERILSRRLLHFTAEGLFLEDASGFSTPDGSTPAVCLYDPWQDNKLNLEDSHHDPCGWYRLIERFTACRLTFETDRLPAVLGLSKCFEDQLDDGHYLWGLWSRSFHQGLLWMSVDLNPKKLVHGHDSANGTPPSWSWGGWTGRVRFPDHLSTCKAACELVSFEAGTTFGTARSTQGEPPHIKLSLKTLNLKGVTVLRKTARYMEIDFYHSIESRGLALVSLDGERDADVEFAELTLAFVARHHNVETFQEDDLMMEKHTWVHYFLLLSPSQNDMFSYRRAGVGVSKWDFSQPSRPSGKRTSHFGTYDDSVPILSAKIRVLLELAELRTISLY